jgi:hypothetical protein
MSFQYTPWGPYQGTFNEFEGERLVALVRDHQEVVRWALDQGMPPIVVLLAALWAMLEERSKADVVHQLLGNILGSFAASEGYVVDSRCAASNQPC